ncbi:hypothetical protein FNYG_15661 [Fusarium nygamai]|uniref:Uncharacterized protein n=1 Tax=Gibberella nygamai TaxID=42673 RepID=A0A2K0U819_GIBNY|nr:hypothetical protein FNYG_15661 [Fusarium nygamai]
MAPQKPRSRSPHPEDRGWVSSAMRKRGATAIKKNYQFGKDCGTIAFLVFYNKVHGFWDGSVYIPEGESLPEDTNEVVGPQEQEGRSLKEPLGRIADRDGGYRFAIFGGGSLCPMASLF